MIDVIKILFWSTCYTLGSYCHTDLPTAIEDGLIFFASCYIAGILILLGKRAKS